MAGHQPSTIRIGRKLGIYKPAGGAWGRGDAVWVCDSRFGNCSDFHSLFISLCRSNGVPARFRIGFPIGRQAQGRIGGYHCWAQFAEGGQSPFAPEVEDALRW